MENQRIDGALFSKLVEGGAACLRRHEDEVNDLNVFPIPDGDTGSNMLLTVSGGWKAGARGDAELGKAARAAADGMLLSARGNSGVILSQFFDGVAAGFENIRDADADALSTAFLCGVDHAYAAVVQPVEGTVLTVMRSAAQYAAAQPHTTVETYFSDFLSAAERALQNTPEQLPVLKKAGVVDSGGAGFIYIIEGMAAVLRGESVPEYEAQHAPAGAAAHEIDLDRFDENSELTYGYCTELLLRLQNAKTDIAAFDVNVIKDYLQSVGESVVCFQTGSIVKLHVHTKTPYKVLQFCQNYGEYLTVKIENMSLQHNNLSEAGEESAALGERKPFAVVAVAAGPGVKETFTEMGADHIVEGGQSMNPSTDDFIEAFKAVNADTIFVLPNNGNVILAAKQAAKLYTDADVRVIESHTIGDCYAVLSMLDTDGGDADEIEESMKAAMDGVVTAAVSKCVRDTEMNGFALTSGQYIGFIGKEILAAADARRDAVCMLVDHLDFADREICILVRGVDSDPAEAEDICAYIRKVKPSCEVYAIDGGQDVYSYILILE